MLHFLYGFVQKLFLSYFLKSRLSTIFAVLLHPSVGVVTIFATTSSIIHLHDTALQHFHVISQCIYLLFE